MKYYTLLTIILLSGTFLASCHDEKDTANGLCQGITLGQPFIGRIDETWCLQGDSWEITFGPVLEDSRCNVPDVDCFWEGRYVMGALIDNGEVISDMFDVHLGATDTLYSGGYRVIITRVFPETRASFDPLDPSEYSFEVTVK